MNILISRSHVTFPQLYKGSSYSAYFDLVHIQFKTITSAGWQPV